MSLVKKKCKVFTLEPLMEEDLKATFEKTRFCILALAARLWVRGTWLSAQK